jgi:hypothetical protein
MPPKITPVVLARLVEVHKGSGVTITTQEIHEMVCDVLLQLESDPAKGADFKGIREASIDYEKKKSEMQSLVTIIGQVIKAGEGQTVEYKVGAWIKIHI